MLSLRGLAFSACSVLFLALGACSGDGTGPAPIPTVECTDASVVELSVGEHVILDPAERGSCVRVPAAGSAGAQYVYAAVSTAGQETQSGTSTAYRINGAAAGGLSADLGPAPAVLPDPTLRAFRARPSAAAFHRMLRERERAATRSPAAALFAARRGAQGAVAAAVTRPPTGHQRTFNVCGTPDCKDNEFVTVTATARHVGDRVAIYVDQNAPTVIEGGYSQADLDRVGTLFDDHLYRIDTTAFGRESDIDNNGVVIVLLTPRVNALSDDCSNSVILGYFFGEDLIPGTPQAPKSNGGEIFYGLVPDPNNLECSISTAYANVNIPPTFVHEFQHMISFNQHFLEEGSSDEDLWLNEGLSHFAEEIAGRVLAAETDESACDENDCLSQFAGSNLANHYNYLADLEANYLVAPGNSGGSLEERGAAWSFVRWLVDQYGTDPYGRNVTRALVNTSRVGAANVEAVVDEPFARLVPRWQLANYLEDLPEYTGDDVLQYPSWRLREAYDSAHARSPSTFPLRYPLVPDQVAASGYTRSGTLRAGSGRHLLVTQPAGGAAVDVRLTAGDGQSLPAATARVMIGVARVR